MTLIYVTKVEMDKKATIQEIADVAGTSRTTVSYILSDKNLSNFSEKTISKVKKIASDMNYRTNFAHKLLNNRETNTLAIVVSSYSTGRELHISQIIITLTEEFQKIGYFVYISQLPQSGALDKVLDLMNRGCDKFFIIGTIADEKEVEQCLIDNSINYIGYNSDLQRNIRSNIESGVANMIRFFLKRGLTRFKILVPETSKSGFARIGGIEKVFPALSHDEVMKKYVYNFPFYKESISDNYLLELSKIGYNVTKKLFESSKIKPEVLIYYTDYFAVGGIKYLFDNNYKIGQDILVAGVNNTPQSFTGPIPFTSVGFDIKEICKTVIENLFKSQPISMLVKTIEYFRPEEVLIENESTVSEELLNVL